MRRPVLVLALLALAGCGSGAGTPGAEVPAVSVSAVAPNAVASLSVIEELPGDDDVPFGVRTYDLILASGKIYHIEWTGGTIRIGDLITEAVDGDFVDIYAAGDFVDYRYTGANL